MSSSGSGTSSPAPSAVGRGRGRGRRAVPVAGAVGGPPEEEVARAPPSPDEDKKVAAIQDQMKKLNITEIVQRPGYGSSGRPIQLQANYFEISIGEKGLVVQQYDIKVTRKLDREGAVSTRKIDRDEHRDLFWQCVKENSGIFVEPGAVVFDDTHICYSLNMLQFPGGKNEHTFTLRTQLYLDNRPTNYEIKFQYATSHLVDLKETAAASHDKRSMVSLQVIDLVINQGRKCPMLQNAANWAPFGRSVYRVLTERDAHRDGLGSGRQLWHGYQAAGKVGEGWKPLLNVDIANTAFYKRISLMEFLCEVLNEKMSRGGGGGRGGRGGRGGARGGRGGGNGGGGGDFSVAQLNAGTELTEDMRRHLDQNLKGVKLKTTHMQEQKNRVYKYTGLGRAASQTFFEMQDGSKSSIADYFGQRYTALQYPNLPCIQVGPRQKNIFIPMECMDLYGPQKVTKKLSDQQTATMIRASARPAAERKQAIEAMMQDANIGRDPFMQKFGLQMNLQMVDTPGRILDNQSVIVNGGKRNIEVSGGEWKYGQNGFFQPVPCASYSLLSLVGRDQQTNLETFCHNLVMTCKSMGMEFGSEWPEVVEYARGPDDIPTCLERIRNQSPDCRIVIVPMRARDTAIYSAVKQKGDVEMGLMTQCILWKNAMNVAEKPPGPNAATAVNIAMKINIKLGGITSGLRADQVWGKLTEAEDAATLFLGVDVTHPGVGDDRSPSIGCVVGNVDLAATRFGANIKVQKHRRETVVYMQDEAKERIMQFYQLTKRKPQRIIIYRDGVSEGQFLTILNEEMMGIRNACLDLHETYKPAITFIVVQKRHHSRLFVKNPRDGAGRMGNVPPGTVVDRAITHPCEFDFFLCSHIGIQGTSRPTHYYVLHDESGFSADELQITTYQLCHLYGRCPRVVSIPAPVYFADLCCTRARYHVRKTLDQHSSDSSSTGGRPRREDSEISEQELVAAVTVNAANKNEMYFI